MDKIKILLVDNDLLFSKALTQYLNRDEGLFVAAVATNKQEAVERVLSVEPNIILMDINLSGNNLDGIEMAMELQELSDAKIIILTGLNKEEIILDSFSAGAVNYVSKANFKELPDIIRSAVQNSAPIELLLNDYKRLLRQEQLNNLTNAEKEVFELIVQGYTQSQIEQMLYKSESTIKNQVNRILKKFGARSCKEIRERMRKKGLI